MLWPRHPGRVRAPLPCDETDTPQTLEYLVAAGANCQDVRAGLLPKKNVLEHSKGKKSKEAVTE